MIPNVWNISKRSSKVVPQTYEIEGQMKRKSSFQMSPTVLQNNYAIDPFKCPKNSDAALDFAKNEKEEKEYDEKIRQLICEQILSNRDDTKIDVGVTLGGLLGGIIFGLLGTSTITLLPSHNVIEKPGHWYEFWIQSVFGFLPLLAADSIYRTSSWMNTDLVKKTKICLKLYFVGVVAATILIFLVYHLWRYVMHFPYPMPFQGMLVAIGTLVTVYVHLWFQFPTALRKNENFRERMKYTFKSLLISATILIQYQLIVVLFLKISQQFQWILALFLPVVRELNLAMMLKLTKKASLCKSWRVECSVTHYLNTRHAMFLSIIIGTVATLEASLIIIGIDVMINLYLCLKLIYLKMGKPETASKQRMILQTIVLNEHVEFVTPIAYFVCFLCAYYGPNGEYIGNIKFGGWGFNAIDDIDQFYENIAKLFLADLSSVILCAVLLWFVCKINLFRAYYQMLNNHWLEISIQTAFIMELVSTIEIELQRQKIQLLFYHLNT